MSDGQRFRKGRARLGGGRKNRRAKRGPLGRSLHLEPLEDRRLLAVYAVNNSYDLDAGNGFQAVVGSLRQAVGLANANAGFDTIIFQDFLFDSGPRTIALDAHEAHGGPLLLTDKAGVEIIGPGPGVLTVSAAGNNRIFLVDDGDEKVSSPVTISGLTLSNGSPQGDDEDGRGGAILNREFLTLREVAIVGSFAPGGGGAIFNDTGFVQIDRSLIQDNTSQRGGGGIQNGLADQTDNLPRTAILNSTITGNTATGILNGEAPTGYGGGVLNLAGTVDIEQSTIYGNSTSVAGGGVASRGFDPEVEEATDPSADPRTDGFETGGFTALPWVTSPEGSDVPWTVDQATPNTGTFSARAGTIGDSQSSSLEIELMTGVGDISFFRKISSEEGSDFLRFFIDGVEQAAWSGDLDFASLTFPVSGGLHTFRWTYEKDGTGLGGDDTAFIDDIQFPPPPPPPPVATVFSGLATTNIRSSIIVGNTKNGTPNDVASIGMTDDDPPAPFEPQINSEGYNLFGMLAVAPQTVNLDMTLPPFGPDDIANVDPSNVFVEDTNGTAWLNDFGGVLPVFMPDINKVDPTLLVNPAIDRGDPNNAKGNYDQRGSQWVRAFDATGLGTERMDIGAAEVQLGNFTVSTLVDETDGRFSNVPVLVGAYPYTTIDYVPDFSLREALEFARKNLASNLPGTNTVAFDDVLTDPDLNPDPTLGTPAPTILLTAGDLVVDFPVDIQGPAFDLEIDATGNGSRVFTITNTVEISNLILRGGNQQEFGGAIRTSGDFILRNSTILDNYTTGFGGAIYVQSGTLLVDSTTIRDNMASIDGGGIYVASGNVTVNNSTISGNTGFRGGGIANASGDLLIRYSTITLNTASPGNGGGVASFRNASATTNIRSSIIAGNDTNDVQHMLAGSDNIVSLGYNVVGDGNAVTAGIFFEPGDQPNVADPMLDPLARLGGPTPVHRLLPGSPAINMGDPNSVGLGNVPMFDQRGFPFDRIEPDSADRIDIGAFEVQDGVLYVGDVNMGASFSTFVEALDESNSTLTKESIVFLPSWLSEIFPGNLAITDSVDIFGLAGMYFYGTGGSLEILVDDGDSMSLLDVSMDSIRMQDNTRVVSRENLTFTNMQFISNAATGNGGAISQQNGKLTISDSSFIGNSVAGPGNSGGAVHVLNGDLEINNSFLSGNTTDNTGGGKGGAIYIRDGNFMANYLYITGNVAAAATGQGGGIFGRDSTMVLTNAMISGNSTTGSNSEGGGLSAKDSQITLIDSAITFNTTLGSQAPGGGIFLDGGSLNIQNGNLFANGTSGQDSSGGAISAVNAEVTITGTSVNGNQTSGDASHGGGIHVVGGNLTVRDSTISGNEVSGNSSLGGGIFSATDLTGASTTRILNSTLSGNAATGASLSANKSLSRGGGFYNAAGLTVFQHSTITDNQVPYLGQGGGVASVGDPATTRTEVLSTIISGNTANNALTADFDTDTDVDGTDFLFWQRGFGSGPGATQSSGDASLDGFVDGLDLTRWQDEFGTSLATMATDVDYVGGSFTNSVQSLGYNLIGSGLAVSGGAFSGPGDQIDVNDPILGPLASNGGTTRTHEVLEGSPAVNAGDPSFDSANFSPAMTTDQRGADRVQLGRIDIGSVESAFSPTLPSDFDQDGDVDGGDFLSWQRGFGVGPGAPKTAGDANSDGFVDGVDLTTWQSEFGDTAATSAATAVSTTTATTTTTTIVAALVVENSATSDQPVALASQSVSPALVSTLQQTVGISDIANFASHLSLSSLVEDRLTSRLSMPIPESYRVEVAARDQSLAEFVSLSDSGRLLSDAVVTTLRRLADDSSEATSTGSGEELIPEDVIYSLLGTADL